MLLVDIELSGRLLDDTWEDLERDLNALKNYAKGVVSQITRVNLMVEAEGIELPYLTCVDVGVEDYPWTEGRGDMFE